MLLKFAIRSSSPYTRALTCSSSKRYLSVAGKLGFIEINPDISDKCIQFFDALRRYNNKSGLRYKQKASSKPIIDRRGFRVIIIISSVRDLQDHEHDHVLTLQQLLL